MARALQDSKKRSLPGNKFLKATGKNGFCLSDPWLSGTPCLRREVGAAL